MHALKEAIAQKYGDKLLTMTDHLNELAITIDRKDLLPMMREFSQTYFNFLMDLTVVDYLRQNHKPRFEVVYHLFHTETHQRVRVKVPVPEEDPQVDSVYGLWQAAHFLEREAWDLYGIKFQGHPDLRRVLMYEEFVGFPLRKDYPIRQEQPRIPLREVQVVSPPAEPKV